MTSYQWTVSVLLAGTLVYLPGCATWSTGSVDHAQAQGGQTYSPTQPQNIIITDGDLPDRPSTFLGEVHVTVNKTTAFHADPTREQVNEALREKAAELGADAVTQVKYSDTHVGWMSWGSMDGDGRAIKFAQEP